MAQTSEGAKKANQTILERRGPTWRQRIGSMGGKAGNPENKGFASMDREKVRELGRQGGLKSRRGPDEPERPRKWLDKFFGGGK